MMSMQSRYEQLRLFMDEAEQQVLDSLPAAVKESHDITVTHDPGRNLTKLRMRVKVRKGGRPEGGSTEPTV